MSSGATSGLSSSVTLTPTTVMLFIGPLTAKGMIFEELKADDKGTVTPARLLAPLKNESKWSVLVHL